MKEIRLPTRDCMGDVPDQVANSLIALKNNVPFNTILEWLLEVQKNQERRNRYEIDEVRVRMGQGRCQMVDGIIESNKHALEQK